jgi:hypothetical protein
MEPLMEIWEEKIRKKLGKDNENRERAELESVGYAAPLLTTLSVGGRYISSST